MPHSPAYDSNEALEDPQAKHLKLKVTAEHPEMGTFTTVRSPSPSTARLSLDILPPPTLGEHNEEVRAELDAPKT